MNTIENSAICNNVYGNVANCMEKKISMAKAALLDLPHDLRYNILHEYAEKYGIQICKNITEE